MSAACGGRAATVYIRLLDHSGNFSVAVVISLCSLRSRAKTMKIERGAVMVRRPAGGETFVRPGIIHSTPSGDAPAAAGLTDAVSNDRLLDGCGVCCAMAFRSGANMRSPMRERMSWNVRCGLLRSHCWGRVSGVPLLAEAPARAVHAN